MIQFSNSPQEPVPEYLRMSDVIPYVRKHGWKVLGASWGILLLSLLATATSAWVTHRSIAEARAERFRLQSLLVAETMTDILTSHGTLLRAAQGFFSAGGDVNAGAWARFVDKLDLKRNHPGVQGIGYAEIVPRIRLATHLERQRKADPSYAIRPAGEREIYSSIVMLEPRNWRNARAIGFDMYSEAVRRSAMDAARTSGEVRMTSAVTLIQETEEDIQNGVLAYLPVYGSQTRAASSGSRDVQGYVYAAFRMQALFDVAIRAQLPHMLQAMSVRLYDGAEAARAAVLFDSESGRTSLPGTDALRQSLTLTHAGQTWQLSLESKPGFTTVTEQWGPPVVLLTGLMGSVLISLISATLAIGRQRALDAQARIQSEMERRLAAQELLERANAEIRISNQELVHRVKNMMAVVTSIASQTARYTPEPRTFVRVFRERLAALGRVHDFLKSNPNFKPGLGRLVPEILAPFCAAGAKSLRIRGEDTEITQSTAMLLSLVLSELATNAMTYGAWKVPNGTVELTWTRSGEGPDSFLAFVWKESGGPPVSEPVRRGFGSNVLKFAIEQGLRGQFRTTYAPSGLVSEWGIPWKSATRETSMREY